MRALLPGVRARLVATTAAGLLAALTVPARVFAQEGDTASGLGTGVASGWDWLGLSLKLGLVLVAIWLVILGMRWYVRRTGGPVGVGRAQSRVQLLETRGLGSHRSLQLVRLGDRAVLLGVTQERITPLIEVNDPEELERLTAVEEPAPGARSFSSFLSGFGDSFANLRERRRTRGGGSDAPVAVEDWAGDDADAGPYQGMRVSDLQRVLAGEAEPGEGAAS